MADQEQGIRLDRWLWAARFFKTRALAAEAIDGGKVELNGQRAKRSKLLQPGDRLRIRKGPFEQVIVVQGLSERRGPASEAQTLYEETAESREARTKLAAQLKAENALFTPPKGKPSKKERRELSRLKRRNRPF